MSCPVPPSVRRLAHEINSGYLWMAFPKGVEGSDEPDCLSGKLGFCGSWSFVGAGLRPANGDRRAPGRHKPTQATPLGRLRRHSPSEADLPPVSSSLMKA